MVDLPTWVTPCCFARYRDTKVKEVKAGQVNREVWRMTIMFPLWSLHAQDTWIGIQAVFTYAEVKVLKTGMAGGL